MNIEQAKAIAIAEILERLELRPSKENETDAYFHSPFRNERTPSFHVNKKDNVWYDHGEGIGGNAFDLVLKILEVSGYGYQPADGLRWIRNTNLDPSLPKPRDPVKNKQSKWKLLDVMQLENLALIRYLNRRGINIDIAKKYTKEVYAIRRGTLTKIFAIGFKNEDGGYELRNKFFKSSISPKTITFIRADKPKPDGVIIFEGFMDFLTYATINNCVFSSDVIVLNSVACVDHAIRYIKNYGYRFVCTYLDNDKSGDKATKRLAEFIRSEPGLVHKPMNDVYAGHEDYNAWHMASLSLKPI